MLAVFCGGAAVLGHFFPVYLQLKGGKGVATGAGILFAMNWIAGVVALGIFLVVFLAFRYVSLASILCSAPLPVLQFFTWKHFEHRWKTHWPITIFMVLLVTSVIYRHRENIRRLWRGEEKRFGSKDKDS